MDLNLTANVQKYFKWGLIATGVGIIGYSIYKATKKPATQSAALSGTGRRRKRKKAGKSKTQKRLSLK
jgi:hypothetical protein